MIETNTFLSALGFKQLTKVQEQAIPILSKGDNLIVSSPTGTGKTHAYLIPIFQKVCFENHSTKVLIIVPTRELAEQIGKNVQFLAKQLQLDINVGLAYGGVDKKRTSKNCDILIGTPGRIHDLVYKDGSISLSSLNMLIFDEADMLFDSTFLTQLDELVGSITNLPQFAVFSATLNKPLMVFISKYMNGAQKLEVENLDFFKDKFNHKVILAPNDRKLEILEGVVEAITPYLCLIFVNNKDELKKVYDHLALKTGNIGIIHGDLTQRERKQTLKRIHQLDFQFVLCSDIAARGIDIEGVSHVINYDLPKEFVYFIHRIGRSGRAQLKGEVISLLNEKEWIIAAEKFEKMVIPFDIAALKKGEIVLTTKRNRLKSKLEDNVRVEVSKSRARKSKNVKPGYKKKNQRRTVQLISSEKNRNKLSKERKARKAKKVANDD